ncbi:MAG: PDZ domain-containing protein [Sulfurimonas sp.]|nr:PDZ domain-containing protein [Sulfurimonas sp.]MDQ7061777.1 PDZ domain-containing protein [Sulfurimonas sp.]
MLRVFLALNFLLFNLYACDGGYTSCINKIKDSQSIQNKTLQIPISKHKRLVFSLTKPKAKILKHDPFLSLYIVEDKKGFKYPFKINMRYPSGIGLVTDKKAKETRIAKRQIGLNEFAKIKTKISVPALLTNSCCSLEGIVTEGGIIEKAYIQRFIHKKDIRYADIGIRVKDSNKGILVVSYDPFMKKNPFRKGDYILGMDGRKVKYSSTLMQRILFSRIGAMHNVKIRRDGKILNIKVRSQKRLSGGYKVETYLEKYGLTFDKNLYIIRIDTSKKFYGLLLGDQLLKVNKQSVKKQEDVMKYISDFKLHPRLLFQRNANFQFFVNMD